MKIKIEGIRQITIKDEYIKLDSLLKYASMVSTGGEAKIYIQNGDIFVNSEVCFMRGKKIRSGDIVRLKNQILKVKSSNDNK